MNKVVLENMKKRNEYLCENACHDQDAKRLKSEAEDMRTPFFHDIDRIIYTLGYTRYLDKTQVFTHEENDHLTRRITHVQFVSKIARTIGRALLLNEDLIEAAALGHDLGHVPYGHVGEAFLNEISLKHGIGYFNHNIQSVRLLMELENYGNGLNLTVQVLDAIMCHNGEFLNKEYYPKEKTIEEFMIEYNSSYQDNEVVKNLRPMTLEGCVVRISDMIAYLGKDIEDAIRLKIINEFDVPSNIKDTLGTKNKNIVNTIVMDIIENSVGKNYIKMSDNIYQAIKDLKSFNYKNIYVKAYSDGEREEIKNKFESLYNYYLNELNNDKKYSLIVTNYLNNMSNHYKDNTSNEQIVLDYIAGMTDNYFNKQYNKLIKLEK